MNPAHLPPDTSSAALSSFWEGWHGAALIGSVTFFLAMIGILGRPVDFVSVLWPANVVLAGLMIRMPSLARRVDTWLAAAAGYIAADLLTGSSLLITVWLTLANLAGASVCTALFLMMNEPARQLRRQTSALRLFGIAFLAALAATLISGPTGPMFFNAELLSTMSLWLGGELLNYVLLLPVILTFPVQGPWNPSSLMGWRSQTPLWKSLLPLLSVVLALSASIGIGGPGALAFVVPALLWCALAYSLFSTAVLCLITCVILAVQVASGPLQFTPSQWMDAMSLRIGITLLSLGPLAAACTRVARKDVMKRLDHAVNFDFLTGAMSRTAFFDQGTRMLQRLAHDQAPVAVLMLDLDHFKTLNDTYGHAAGDQVLLAFSQLVGEKLRPEDILGRLGGEEFVALLPDVQYGEAIAVAERLCDAVRRNNFQKKGLRAPLYATVSIGMAYFPRTHANDNLDLLMQPADKLLYQAKEVGRDRVAYGIYLDRGWNRAHSPSVSPSDFLTSHATGKS